MKLSLKKVLQFIILLLINITVITVSVIFLNQKYSNGFSGGGLGNVVHVFAYIPYTWVVMLYVAGVCLVGCLATRSILLPIASLYVSAFIFIITDRLVGIEFYGNNPVIFTGVCIFLFALRAALLYGEIFAAVKRKESKIAAENGKELPQNDSFCKSNGFLAYFGLSCAIILLHYFFYYMFHALALTEAGPIYALLLPCIFVLILHISVKAAKNIKDWWKPVTAMSIASILLSGVCYLFKLYPTVMFNDGEKVSLTEAERLTWILNTTVIIPAAMTAFTLVLTLLLALKFKYNVRLAPVLKYVGLSIACVILLCICVSGMQTVAEEYLFNDVYYGIIAIFWWILMFGIMVVFSLVLGAIFLMGFFARREKWGVLKPAVSILIVSSLLPLLSLFTDIELYTTWQTTLIWHLFIPIGATLLVVAAAVIIRQIYLKKAGHKQ